jgi:serine/threonine-protein kinase RsbW
LKKVEKISIPSDPDKIQLVERKTERFATRIGLSEDDIDSLGIAVTEVVSNAIKHGNRGDISKKVHIEFTVEDRCVKVVIRDEGKGFDPDDIANPLDPENLYKDSGRGIFIVKELMDDVGYRFNKKGTEIILIKKIE